MASRPRKVDDQINALSAGTGMSESEDWPIVTMAMPAVVEQKPRSEVRLVEIPG